MKRSEFLFFSIWFSFYLHQHSPVSKDILCTISILNLVFAPFYFNSSIPPISFSHSRYNLICFNFVIIYFLMLDRFFLSLSFHSFIFRNRLRWYSKHWICTTALIQVSNHIHVTLLTMCVFVLPFYRCLFFHSTTHWTLSLGRIVTTTITATVTNEEPSIDVSLAFQWKCEVCARLLSLS